MGKRSRDRRRTAEQQSRAAEPAYAPQVVQRQRPSSPPKPGVSRSGFVLGDLASTVERIRRDEARRDRLLVAAREHGVTLSELAEVLGVSIQAVQQRLARMDRA